LKTLSELLGGFEEGTKEKKSRRIYSTGKKKWGGVRVPSSRGKGAVEFKFARTFFRRGVARHVFRRKNVGGKPGKEGLRAA